MNDDQPCPYCDGTGHWLGTLGTTTHYRCRDCGGQWSTK